MLKNWGFFSIFFCSEYRKKAHRSFFNFWISLRQIIMPRDDDVGVYYTLYILCLLSICIYSVYTVYYTDGHYNTEWNFLRKHRFISFTSLYADRYQSLKYSSFFYWIFATDLRTFRLVYNLQIIWGLLPVGYLTSSLLD